MGGLHVCKSGFNEAKGKIVVTKTFLNATGNAVHPLTHRGTQRYLA